MAIISTELVTLDPFGPEQQAFVAHMRRQERSEKTVDAYVWALKHFRRFMRHQSIERFDQINRELLEEWQDHLATTPNPATGKPLSARSRSLAQTAIRMFFLWAAQREKCDAKLALWFTKIKVPDLKPKPLETDRQAPRRQEMDDAPAEAYRGHGDARCWRRPDDRLYLPRSQELDHAQGLRPGPGGD